MHAEMAHNMISPHNAEFFKLWDELWEVRSSFYSLCGPVVLGIPTIRYVPCMLNLLTRGTAAGGLAGHRCQGHRRQFRCAINHTLPACSSLLGPPINSPRVSFRDGSCGALQDEGVEGTGVGFEAPSIRALSAFHHLYRPDTFALRNHRSWKACRTRASRAAAPVLTRRQRAAWVGVASCRHITLTPAACVMSPSRCMCYQTATTALRLCTAGPCHENIAGFAKPFTRMHHCCTADGAGARQAIGARAERLSESCWHRQ